MQFSTFAFPLVSIPRGLPRGSLFGGGRYASPFLLRLDTSLNIKFTSWYYDSTRTKKYLSQSATTNGLYESAHGKIITVAGDVFPTNQGQNLNNYAAYLEFDSLGVEKRVNEWSNTTGYNISGWNLASDEITGLMLGGNESVFYVDTMGVLKVKNNYTFSLPGVGTENNRVMRIRRLRNGMVLAVGQAYEEDCWTRWQRLSYDGWWAPLSIGGASNGRYTTGESGQDDILYDATQLVDGKIVLVGYMRSLDQIGGIWVIVTDSTSKNILWEKQVPIHYRGDKGKDMYPFAVVATPDSGFTVVGLDVLVDSLGGTNAFAAHFVPKQSVATLNRSTGKIQVSSSQPWLVEYQFQQAGEAILQVVNVEGKVQARYRQKMESAGTGVFRVNRRGWRREFIFGSCVSMEAPSRASSHWWINQNTCNGHGCRSVGFTYARKNSQPWLGPRVT